jgi:hypothetical protein
VASCCEPLARRRRSTWALNVFKSFARFVVFVVKNSPLIAVDD